MASCLWSMYCILSNVIEGKHVPKVLLAFHFYSLCIQGHVRKVVVKLAKTGQDDCLDDTDTSDEATCNFKQYLHLALRLFIAASSAYDPLLPDYFTNLTEPSENVDVLKTYKTAQEAVRRDSWSSKGIFSLEEYLARIFEDAGDKLEVEADPYPSQPDAQLIHYPTSGYMLNRMSVDGTTNPQIGGFICTYPSCTAQPFQTQVSRY